MLVLSICAGINVNAQTVNSEVIPLNVKAAFNQRFGTATDWIWNLTADSGFTAIFKQNDRRHYAEVKGNGEIILLKYEISPTDLPIQITEALKTEYPKHKIIEIDKIEKGDTLQYEVELDGYPDYIILFDPLGVVLEKKVD